MNAGSDTTHQPTVRVETEFVYQQLS